MDAAGTSVHGARVARHWWQDWRRQLSTASIRVSSDDVVKRRDNYTDNHLQVGSLDINTDAIAGRQAVDDKTLWGATSRQRVY